MRGLLLLSLLAASCGGGGSGSRRLAGDEAPADPCRAGDGLMACLAQQREVCRDGAQVNRLAYDTLPPMVVGAKLIRLDHLGGRLVGTDSTRWLACFEQCPEGGPARMCFPLALPLRLSWGSDPACERATREAPAWNGMAAQALELSCADGRASLRYVPGLEQAATDLRRVKAIAEDDVLGSLEGLVVEMSAAGSVQSQLLSIEKADCGAFEVPAGYRVVAEAEDWKAMEGIVTAPAALLAEEVEKVRTAVAVEAVARAKAELLPRFRQTYGEACKAKGKDVAVDAELEACVSGIPETEAPFRGAVARETARLFGERRAEIDALTRRLLVAPVCKAFAAR